MKNPYFDMYYSKKVIKLKIDENLVKISIPSCLVPSSKKRLNLMLDFIILVEK